MTDLQIASPQSTPANAARPGTGNLLRAAAPLDGVPEAKSSPFQDALSLELGLAQDPPLLPGQGQPATAAKARASLKPDDALQTAAPVELGLPGLPPLPPGLSQGVTDQAGFAFAPRRSPLGAAAGASIAKPEPAIAAAAAASDFAAPSMVAPAFAGGIVPGPVATGSQHLIATAPAELAPPGSLARRAKGEIAPGHKAQNAELPASVAPAAPDVSGAGKLSASTDGEVRREFTPDAGVSELGKPVPAQVAAAQLVGAAPAHASQAQAASIEARVGARGWDQSLGDKVVWMAGQKQQVAELHLNPPELGPLKITLTLEHDQASAQFVSAHAPVREAIEAAMPRLREMLADNGINLGNASVGTGAFHDQAQARHEPHAQPAVAAVTTVAPGAGVTALGEQLLRRSRGLVDTFA